MKRIKSHLKVRNFPNSLSLFRLILVFPVIYLLDSNNIRFIFPLLIIGAITDYLDGYIANKYKLKTNFGAVIDPVADKIFTIIPLIWLSSQNLIPFWSIAIIIFREFIVSAFRSTKKNGLPASKQAKLKTSFILISLLLLFSPIKTDVINNIGLISYWIGFIFTITTCLGYLRLK